MEDGKKEAGMNLTVCAKEWLCHSFLIKRRLLAAKGGKHVS